MDMEPQFHLLTVVLGGILSLKVKAYVEAYKKHMKTANALLLSLSHQLRSLFSKTCFVDALPCCLVNEKVIT